MSQIQQAVDIANSASGDAALKKQALDFLEQMKSSPEAIEVFTQYLRESSSSDVGRFFALQVLIEQVDCVGRADDKLMYLKQTSVDYLRTRLASGEKTPEFIRNKISELFARLFYRMYGNVNGNLWSGFFGDLIEILGAENLRNGNGGGLEFSSLGLDYFLRICGSINTEIGDQAFVRTKEVQVMNNELKDSMRIADVEVLAKIWFNSLLNCQQYPELASMVLSCIGSYISWIDINLIVQPSYISTIYEYLKFPHTKLACAQCLCEIIAKKMKPADKLQLLSMLNLTDQVTNIGVNEDLEVVEQMAKLTNCVGLELSIIMDQSNDSQELQNVASSADDQIVNVVGPLVFKFMSHEYDSVTQQCFPFVTNYLAFMKKLFAVGGKPGSAVSMNSKRLSIDVPHLGFLRSLGSVCVLKMRIDDACDPDDTEEIDEFIENVRSRLKTFQDSIAVINPQLYYEIISENIEQSISEQQDWRVLELALYQMHNLAESIRNNLFGVNKNEISSSQPSQLMAKYMSMILNHPTLFQMNNSLIQISFFELVVRHNAFIQVENKDMTLLNIFCTPFSMFSSNERVRLRTWYLFTRMIKTSKPKLTTDVLSMLFSKISSLLVVKADPLTQELDTVFDSQLYLFEGIGVLIGANVNNEYEILDGVLTPLFSDLEQCIAAQIKTPALVLQTHHILMAIGTIARGVHNGLVPDNQVNNAKVNGRIIHRTLIEKFSNIAEVILVTFSYFNKFETIRDATRFSFARLTPILNNQILPFASRLISIFLNSGLKTIEMSDFLGYLGQMVHLFKDDENCYQLFNNLFTPMVEKVFALEAELEQESPIAAASSSAVASTKGTNGKNVIVTDSFRDKVTLKKAYYSFLSAFTTNNCSSILLTESNKAILPRILMDLLSYSPEEINETSCMKLSMNVLVNLIASLGTGACTDPKDRNAISVNKLEGLHEFFITKTIPILFEIPFKSEYGFNINDGGCRVVACDLSRLLKALYTINSSQVNSLNDNPCIKYLTEVYFPQIQFPQDLVVDFINALSSFDTKQFEKFFVQFITNLKQ